MKSPSIPSFPGGSKSRVNRAGENVRKGSANAEDFRVIDEWRAAHRNVLNTFQAILRQRQKGDQRYERAMALASEIFARSHESLNGPLPDLPDRELVAQFLALDIELGLIRTLRALNAANQTGSDKRNAILIFSESGELEVRAFRDAPDALRALFELEKQMPERDIVLVRADTSDEVRIAFRNYFSDARDFIKLLEDGCARLADTNQLKRRSRLAK